MINLCVNFTFLFSSVPLDQFLALKESKYPQINIDEALNK